MIFKILNAIMVINNNYLVKLIFKKLKKISERTSIINLPVKHLEVKLYKFISYELKK